MVLKGCECLKLKTRLIIAFLTIITLPVLMSALAILWFGQYQIRSVEKTYGISGTTYKSFSNPVQILNRVTEKSYHDLAETVRQSPQKMEDATYLAEINKKLTSKNAYLLVRKDNVVVYIGQEDDKTQEVIKELPVYQADTTDSDNGIYLGGDLQVLVKQADFMYPDRSKGSAFIIMDVEDVIPEVREFMIDIILAVILILVLTASLLIIWIYQGVAGPISKMKKAAENIQQGNLDFKIEAETDDELGGLCRDFEAMRCRLKANAEEKVKADSDNKELISNISHDLKTPITAIKGYAEGIIDGVADTPEKMNKYIRTIYNKANEMERLINELTFYSNIDTNRIPYNFATIPVGEYFADCAEDLSLELEAKGVAFGYYNYVQEDTLIIADAEQLKRVINNIISNSLKYMDKDKAVINLRVKDVGDFVQVELEDNGKGIGAKELPYIFDRFYRTDASRNSSKGGSGIGLSIVKKIIEEHGGKIWATSKEGTGTTMYFVIRKYQEVPVHEQDIDYRR